VGDVVEGVLRLGWSDGDGDIGVNTGLRGKGMGYYGAKGTWGYGRGESARKYSLHSGWGTGKGGTTVLWVLNV